jgi:hypothetical protein
VADTPSRFEKRVLSELAEIRKELSRQGKLLAELAELEALEPDTEKTRTVREFAEWSEARHG